MPYLKRIELREVPRSSIEENITEAARLLEPDPGPGYNGECRLFRTPRGQRGDDPWPLVCRGGCEEKGGQCGIVHVRTPEGSHSDLYFVLVTCACRQPTLPKPKKKALKPGTIVVQGSTY